MNFELHLKALNGRQFEGYASVFGNVDVQGDVVAPGAFKASLAERRPVMLWMHQPDQVPGAWDEVREDSKGLRVVGTLAPTTLGDEMLSLLKMEAVRGLSIGFRTVDSEWRNDARVLKQVDLHEISLVSLAANPLAEVTAVKSRLSARGEHVPDRRSFERDLREKMCLSRSVARKVADEIYASSAGADAGRSGYDADEAESIARDILRSLA
jgi:uncharacterized protein